MKDWEYTFIQWADKQANHKKGYKQTKAKLDCLSGWVRSNKRKRRDTSEKYRKQLKGLSKQTQQCKNLAESNWTEL